MTATTDALAATRFEVLHTMPTHFERLRWGHDALATYQRDQLRSLLRVAIDRAPFHRARLGDIDPGTFELADLCTLPPMTKSEMMAAYDDVVTDRRLTTEALQAHLGEVGEDAALFADEYFVLASGGSSGVRGMFAYDRSAAGTFMSAVLRPGLAMMAALVGWPPAQPVPMAIVAAPISIHATRILPALGSGTIADITFAPATLPLAEIVERVQRAQPLVLTGYASTIARLADAQRAGELSISPLSVLTTSEQLTPDLAARITAGFGSPPSNSFASSEGLIGAAPPGDDVISFASDLAIVEFVDEHDQPVPAGARAHHVLVTNLFNHAQPLIRYRLDDAMIPVAESPDHGHVRAAIEGRSDEYLHVRGTQVHPLAIRSAMLRHPGIVEYQVRSHGRRLEVDVVSCDPVDLAQVERSVRDALTAAGAGPLPVTARVVETVDRDPGTGKARRFVDVAGASAC